MIRVLRATGWTLITAGLVVALYVVYSLFFTNFETNAAQADLAEGWQRQVSQVAAADQPRPDDAPAPPPDPGSAAAVLEFSRPGTDERPVRADPVYVVSGVALSDLTRGPGHYPGTALPGEDGNIAVAGHRTTYGAPFLHLDQLVAGDEVHVTGRDGERHTYRVVRQEVVLPTDVWVLDPDPLKSGAPTLTLTTCHPRFSAAQRLVVFAELV